MHYTEFSQKIKTKYPEYQNMDDRELAQKIVAKYPQYNDITFDEVQQPQQPQPQPKNVVPNRPANQELKVEEPTQDVKSDFQLNATKNYTQEMGADGKTYLVDENGNRVVNNDLSNIDKIKNNLNAKFFNAKQRILSPTEQQHKDDIKRALFIESLFLPGSIGAKGAVGWALGGGLGAGTLTAGENLIDEGKINPAQTTANAIIGALSGGSLYGIGKGAQFLYNNPTVKKVAKTAIEELVPGVRRYNINKRKATPLADRMTPEQLERATNPNSYENMSMEQLEQATNPYNNMTMEELEKATAPNVNYEPSTYGVNNNNIDSQAIANQFNTRINKARNEIQTFTDFSNNLKAKYGSIDNLRKIVAEDVDEFGKPKSQFEAQMDLDNYLRMQDELTNSTTPYLEQAGQIDKRFKQLDNAVEVPQNANKYVEPIVDPQPQSVAQPVVPQTQRVVQTPVQQQPKGALPKGKKYRSFGDERYSKEIQEAVTDKTYNVNSRELEKSGWEALTPEQQQALINDTNAMSPVAIYGKAQAVEKAIANGEKPSQVMLNGVAKNATEAGQTIESLKNFLPTTPKGIAMAITKQARDEAAPSAIKIIDNAESIANELRNIRIPDKKKAIEQILKKHGVVPRLKNKPASLINDLSKLKDLEALDAETLIELVQNKYKIPTVTVDDYVKMDELANKFATATTDREKQIATGLIKKFVNDKGIKDFSKMEKSFRMINMLYTGAGRIADAGFTGLNQGIRAIDDIFARGISAVTNSGTRGKSTPISQWLKDVYTGGKNAAEDIDMNISTPRGWETDRYDLGFTPQFEGVPILGGAEKGLRYGIEVPDRAWSNGTYEAVKRDLKSAGGFTDEEIEKIASDEALRSVYQKDAGATKLSGDILKHLNDFGKEYGVNIGIGNRISPFYRTTTNLYSDALARTTGYDFLMGALKRAKATTKAEVREAENQMARGITGLGLTGGLGYVGANTINNIGQLNPIDTYGDDVTGMAPQSIVIGDKSYSLGRNPLLTIAMGIGKELYSDDPAVKKLMKMAANTGAVAQDFPAAKNLGSIVKGLGTVQEQLEASNDEKFLQALNRGLTPAIANIVNQDVPFGAMLGAVRVGADPFNHEIYSDNPVEYFWNLTKNRYPGLSSTLPIKYNAMGEPSLRSNINNGQARFYDALLNPTPVRNYNSKGATVRDDLDKFAQVAKENKYAGRTNVPLKKLARSIEVNGEKKVLNNKEYSEAQRLYGKLQTKYKKDIFNQKGWSDAKKVEELSKIRHDAEEAVKIKLFNHKKRNGKYTNRMIDDIKNGDL